MNSRIRKLPLTLLVLLGAMTLVANAKTQYVDKWGVNSLDCTKTDPCSSIQAAVDNAAINGKVIVGPGTYFEDVYIDNSGLKLESTGGRYATIIDITALGDLNAIEIVAPKVQIGKKGKGFTVVGARNVDRAAMLVDISSTGEGRLKIEGNRLGSPRAPGDPNFSNQYGVWIQRGGGKLQFRGNIAVNNDNMGFRCDDCVGAIIRDNRSESNDNYGFEVANMNQGTFDSNVSSGNANYGIYINDSERARIRNNVAEGNLNYGLYSGFTQDAPDIRGNISARNTNNGIHLRLAPAVTLGKAIIAGNLSVSNLNHGMNIETDSALKLEGNTVIQNADDGIRLDGGAPLKTLKSNGIMSNVGCALDGDGGTFVYTRHFHRVNLAPCNGLFDGSTLSTKPPRLKVNKARAL